MAYPIANVAHVLGLVGLLGAIGVYDLRMLGWGRALPAQTLLAAVRPLAIGGFGLLALSGAVLFAADAVALAGSDLFRVKLVLIVAAVANAAAFEWMKPHGRPAAAFAAASLILWITVAVAGRMIAYV